MNSDLDPSNGKAAGSIAADEVRLYYATNSALSEATKGLSDRISNIEGQFSMGRWLIAAVFIPSVTSIIMAALMLVRIWNAP